MALYMTVTTMGPVLGPIISGFSSEASWRWPFWVAAMITAPGLPLVLTLPETYAPVIFNREIKKRMKNGGSPSEDDLAEIHPFNAKKIFLRPMTLLITEPILLSTSLYLALAYAVFYLMFQAYPIIFQDFYGLAPGPAGLLFLPSMCDPDSGPCEKTNAISCGRRLGLTDSLLGLQLLLRSVLQSRQALGSTRDISSLAPCLLCISLVSALRSVLARG